MYIENLLLKNYRNHKALELEFPNALTLLIGNNGAGKTNILEAINMLSTGKSSKARYDADIINYDYSFCTVTGSAAASQDKIRLDLQILRTETTPHSSIKKAKINKVSKTLHSFYGMFNSVLFMPEDIQLITGSPSERRHYIDALLTQTDTKYKKVLGHYLKAVRQRNRILEKINEEGRGFDELEFWNTQVIENGQYIQYKRDYMFARIQPILNVKGMELNSNRNEIEIKYYKNEISKSRIEAHKAHEIAAKTTLVGPHRDDFEIFMDKRNIAEFGSRGQQRSAVLALKLSEIDFIENEKGERPVLLLDDIFSELDEIHQNAVVDVIRNQQTIITSTENIPQIDFNDTEIMRI